MAASSAPDRPVRRRKASRPGLLAIAGLVVVAVGAASLVQRGEFPGGMRSSYDATDFDPRLTREARTALDLIEAIDRYRHDRAVLPADEADLAPYFGTSRVPSWRYARRGEDRYSLWHKLGWDPSLRYEVDGAVARWVFDPGDGSVEKVLQLRP